MRQLEVKAPSYSAYQSVLKVIVSFLDLPQMLVRLKSCLIGINELQGVYAIGNIIYNYCEEVKHALKSSLSLVQSISVP